MLELGVQTKEIVFDENPKQGFKMMREAGFVCADFSLNSYLLNLDIYNNQINRFFDASVQELEEFFRPHKLGAKEADVRIHQMHMPYPIYIPTGMDELNDYLWHQMAPKSMELCEFLDCRYIVIHGFKLARELGSEALEWAQTEKFIDFLAPMAKELGITICVENLYNALGRHMVEGPCCNAVKAAERIARINERYGAEVVGFCFDTGHANLVGLDMEEFITNLGQCLKVLHIHDNDGVSDLHQIPYTFTRTRENSTSTDWQGFIRGLKKIAFNGVLSFETAPVLTAFPERLRCDALQMINKIGQHFAAEIEGKSFQ